MTTADRNPASEESRHQILSTAGKLAGLIRPGHILGSLEASASWLEAATSSVIGSGVCHRMAVYYRDGKMLWLYPHSNTGEVLSTWLDLAESLDRPEYIGNALEYAYELLDDPIRGLYRGEERAAHGLAWYWTDGGSYAGLYSMRMPFHFYRLYQRTGEERFLEICDVIGGTLSDRQLGSGLVDACWSPEKSWAEGGTRIGCRFIYSLATFATLHRITGEARYQAAYERSVGALLKMQNPDGSFFQHYVVETAEPHPIERSVKPFFYGYILNAIAEAYEVFHDERILDVARRLGDCLARLYRYRNAIPYCTGEMPPADETEAEAFVADSANGLLWLADQTGVETYRDIGTKLWFDAWKVQLDDPEQKGWHGAIIQGSNPDLAATLAGVPTSRPHLHYDPAKLGKCSLWGMVNHVSATKRLLQAQESFAESNLL